MKSIYTDDDIIQQEPEIIQVAKHLLEVKIEEEKRASENDEDSINMAVKLLQE